MPAPPIKVETVEIDVLQSGDDRWPWKVRIRSRGVDGKIVGVRNLRALTETDANERADLMRRSVASE